MSVSGSGEVAALLHKMADGARSGSIQIGPDSYTCPTEISAVVEAGDDQQPVTVLTIRLSAGERWERRPGQVVEQELTHPGG